MEAETKLVSGMELHHLTETHPVMAVEQYEAFKADIATNGQLQPVILYRNKIVDGRHRLKALKELGEKSIKTVSLPNNLTLTQVKAKVLSTEKRRHQSPTQLAIRGYREYKAGMKQSEAVTSTGCSLSNLQHVVALEKLGRLDVIDLLEKGGKVDIGVTNYSKFTDSLLGIVTWIKKQQAHTETLLQELTKEVDTDTEKSVRNIDIVKLDGLALVAKSSCNKEELKVLIAKLHTLMEERQL
jgi:hypothetical protein